MTFWLVTFRRRRPFPVAAGDHALRALLPLRRRARGPGPVSLATRRNLRQIVAVGVLAVVTGQLYTYYQPGGSSDPPWVNFTFTGRGHARALRLRHVPRFAARAALDAARTGPERAEAEQELRVGQAQSAERARIAREMHDVLAHRISLVTMHAGALAYRTDLPPEQIRETAQLIQTKAHEALTDLRQVLGVLRGDGPADRTRPQPTCRPRPPAGRGQDQRDASSSSSGSCRPTDDVPDQVGRTVYRIVQEGIDQRPQARAGRPRGCPRHRGRPTTASTWSSATRSRSAAHRDPRPGRAWGWSACASGPSCAAAELSVADERASASSCAAGCRGRVIRLLVVDDDPLVRVGADADARRQPDIEVVGEAADGARRRRRGRRAPARRRADGHPDAGDGRARGHRARCTRGRTRPR